MAENVDGNHSKRFARIESLFSLFTYQGMEYKFFVIYYYFFLVAMQ